jgi:hypothetical protein
VLGISRVPKVIQAAAILPMYQLEEVNTELSRLTRFTYQVLQMAEIVTRSLGCDNSLTMLGEAVVANDNPKPRMNLLTTNMGKF